MNTETRSTQRYTEKSVILGRRQEAKIGTTLPSFLLRRGPEGWSLEGHALRLSLRRDQPLRHWTLVFASAFPIPKNPFFLCELRVLCASVFVFFLSPPSPSC